VAGLSYALDIGGMDPVHHLASLRSRLVALRQEIEDARASQSEVVMRRTQGRLADALDLSERIRAVLDRVPAANAAARRVARDVHDLLSRLHGAAADLHAAVTEVGRQYLRLTAGLTTEQVVRALMGRTLAELAALGAEALRAVHAPPPLLDTDVVAAAAEQHALRDRPPASELAWEEPAAAPRADEAVELPAEVAAFVAELADLAAARQARPLHALVPRGDPSESYLRASLLSLVGGGSGGAGVAGSLGALDLAVAAEGDGWPEDLPDGGPLARLTPGRVGPGDGGGG
jgi:hypothetical protein